MKVAVHDPNSDQAIKVFDSKQTAICLQISQEDKESIGDMDVGTRFFADLPFQGEAAMNVFDALVGELVGVKTSPTELCGKEWYKHKDGETPIAPYERAGFILDYYISQIAAEFTKDHRKHPDFPKDNIHRVGIMVEKAGEAVRAALKMTYEGGVETGFYGDIIQTAAMCFRILVALEQDYLAREQAEGEQ